MSRQPELEHIDSHPERTNLEQRMAVYERIYYASGMPGLDVFMSRFMDRYIQTGESTAHALFIEGPGGAGKTTLANSLILPYAQLRAQEIENSYVPDIKVIGWDAIERRELTMIRDVQKCIEVGDDLPNELKVKFNALVVGIAKWTGLKTMDEWGKYVPNIVGNLLRLPGQIQHDKPYPLEFLCVNDVAIKIDLAPELRTRTPYKLLIIDKPGITAPEEEQAAGLKKLLSEPFTKTEEPEFTNTRYRTFGVDMVRSLSEGLLDFEDISKFVHIGYVGMLPGPRMKLYVELRQQVQETIKTRDSSGLETCNRLASTLGLRPFSSYEKLEETPKGGSVEQVDATITAIAAVLKSQYRDTNQRLNLNIPQEIINALNYIYAIAAVGATIGRKATDQVFVKIESEFINEIGNPILKKLIEENIETTRLLGGGLVKSIHDFLIILASGRIMEKVGKTYTKNPEEDTIIVLNNPPLIEKNEVT